MGADCRLAGAGDGRMRVFTAQRVDDSGWRRGRTARAGPRQPVVPSSGRARSVPRPVPDELAGNAHAEPRPTDVDHADVPRLSPQRVQRRERSLAARLPSAHRRPGGGVRAALGERRPGTSPHHAPRSDTGTGWRDIRATAAGSANRHDHRRRDTHAPPPRAAGPAGRHSRRPRRRALEPAGTRLPGVGPRDRRRTGAHACGERPRAGAVDAPFVEGHPLEGGDGATRG